MFFKTKKQPLQEIAGVPLKPSKRAKRMSLRVEAKSGNVVLTVPLRYSVKAAEKFIEENKCWIENKRAKSLASDLEVFRAGNEIEVSGKKIKILHQSGRGTAHIEDGKLFIFGREEHLPRRIKDFLKVYARIEILSCVNEKLAKLELKPKNIRIIDPKTRWGSCSPNGDMMFSWRLILAPPFVLDYVVAHEVSHRVHLNHSKKFWHTCYSLTTHADEAKRWLRAHGTKIMGYK